MVEATRVIIPVLAAAVLVAADVMGWHLSAYTYAAIGLITGWVFPVPAAERKAARSAAREVVALLPSVTPTVIVGRVTPPPEPSRDPDPDPADTVQVDMREVP